MKIAVGILTHNSLSTMRFGLLERTIISAKRAFPGASIYVFDNHSTDGSEVVVAELGGICHREGNGKPGTGRLAMMPVLFGKGDFGPDLIVFSDDDMEWKAGAESKLVEIWAHAPADLLIVGGLLEPVWRWNTPRETLACGAENVLVRDSCPGAAWTFRAHDWGIMEKHMVRDFGYDHKVCIGLTNDEYRVAQVDLADHTGWGCSTHGNEANQAGDARPLDREKWGV